MGRVKNSMSIVLADDMSCSACKVKAESPEKEMILIAILARAVMQDLDLSIEEFVKKLLAANTAVAITESETLYEDTRKRKKEDGAGE